MESITLRIKLMNRIKPAGMEGYKKCQKLPVRLRSREFIEDDLNTWEKKFEMMDDLAAHKVYNLEVKRLMESTPWKLSRNPNYGDMLIGYICDVEYGDFGISIFKTVKKV